MKMQPQKQPEETTQETASVSDETSDMPQMVQTQSITIFMSYQEEE